MHDLLWENTKTAHLEALKTDEMVGGQLPEGMTSEVLDGVLFDQQTHADTAVLKLLQDACVMAKNPLAFDLCRRLRTPNGLNGEGIRHTLSILNNHDTPSLNISSRYPLSPPLSTHPLNTAVIIPS